MNEAPFFKLLQSGEGVGFQTDDVLAAILPLFRQVSGWHQAGQVATLQGACSLVVDESGSLSCSANPSAPAYNSEKVEAIQRPVASALHVIGHGRLTSDDEEGLEYRNLEVTDGEGELKHPAYITGYRTWEELAGHHDAATDVLALGQLLASLALGLDFFEAADLERFASHRDNLFVVNRRLHPVVAGVIVEMTELNRHRRTDDLPSLIQRLENYREQTLDLDVTRLPGFEKAPTSERRKLVQTHLRDRLFEISRRNRLLYFKPSQASVNFTVASVPMVANLASIQLEQLFVWHPALASEVVEGKPMSLGRWLRFEDQPYLPSALDKLIADARRDRAEFGSAQLRLVVAFLHWHNLKETAAERINSPLLLLPVELSKKKGVRDQYILDPTSAEAEVNPILRYHLHQCYGLRLPETIDLREISLEQFHRDLAAQIHLSEPGVTLRLVDKPEIRLIHERARQRLAQFQRRQKLRPAAKKTRSNYSYSYDRENFRPLGLQLFFDKVKPSPLPQRVAAGGTPEARTPHMVAPESANMQETERHTFSLREEGAANPYSWDFDLCSLTVGNFNYRKMSLVRDYGTMLEDAALSSEAFDRVFSLEPRSFEDEPVETPSRVEEWPVVPGDATQTAAVNLGRTGRSYIIQGPPGTGKSQTITNLIADYVARGKRVLFVCEKRAAIDVVYHRLQRQGLDELCCLIHDSQADKKAFVLNLKQTYEKWLAEPDGSDEIQERRNGLLRQMEQDLASLGRFDAAMRSVPEHVGKPIRELIHRLVELKESRPQLSLEEAESLPSFKIWRSHAEIARRLSATLGEVSDVNTLAAHPFRWLGEEVLTAERPLEQLNRLSTRLEAMLDTIEGGMTGGGLPAEYWDSVEKIQALEQFVAGVADLTEHEQLSLLDARSAQAKALDDCVAELTRLNQAVENARKKTLNWREKLPAQDVEAAIAQAKANEQSIFRFLKPSWWRLKKELETRYDFSKHSVQPAYSAILTALAAEYAAATAFDEAMAVETARFHRDPFRLSEHVIALRSTPADRLGLRAFLLANPDAAHVLEKVESMAVEIKEMISIADQLLVGHRALGLSSLGEVVRDLREEADTLPDLLPLLNELIETPPVFHSAIREFELPPDRLEAAVAEDSLEKVYRSERWLPRVDGRSIAHRSERVARLENDWHGENAALIRAQVRRRFREHVHTATLSATQLDAEGKLFKKTYGAGRRELEHEFGKTMRYRSIRDLTASDSGNVIRDLKPVWLMSPLSVSDTLPFSSDLFDVVIFDEASQIPVEEAVPAVYRAPQVIVVGDEMQLPPTSFFSTARDADEDTLEVEEEGDRFSISLEADSFLTQSAKNLPASLLAWHYRSRSESLIGFSNAAFYSGNLFTIPDRMLPAGDEAEIVVAASGDAGRYVEDLRARPLSFHFMRSSPYENRKNVGEAAYIAELVRELLRRETKLSIGVVAFSEAQQGEIDSALETLAESDADFAARLDEESAREEDGQFCGLFVKNLENVQGDERDIILLSICYGPDASGRMLMNFGPINQRGGEKRLNVIFSRARHHMAVVSSFRHHAITNDHNDGAAALKSFLQYAECASRGETRLARGVLENLNPLARKRLAPSAAPDEVASQLIAALRGRGHEVDANVGQSRFRCELGIRAREANHYCVGVIVDTAEYYANENVAERFVTRPEILRTFGWKVMLVLARDWYHEADAVLERIERLMRGETEETAVIEEDSLPVAGPVEIESAMGTSTEPRPAAVPSGGEVAPSRRLEFKEGKSSKFWEVSVRGCEVHVSYGRIGTSGQSLVKTFENPERASNEAEKLTSEKLRKGYQEPA